ncbi:MAG: VIT1/CCC1 transporter family protein, partial [Candidatus Gracilibacteria bacterium]|nr:VIT1/CCC1 transporter family protein [Candidatus Gracilibacteria bacterium]
EEYNREKWEIENYPEGEIEEIRQIYRAKGFTGKDLDQAVKIITSNKEQWLKTMMVEELHIIQENKSPWIVAISTFLAFLICGAIPLLAYAALYFFPTLQISTFTISIIATACTIFIVGSLRSIFIAKHWLPAGLEMLLIGGSASTVAYLVGYLLRGLA